MYISVNWKCLGGQFGKNRGEIAIKPRKCTILTSDFSLKNADFFSKIVPLPFSPHFSVIQRIFKI